MKRVSTATGSANDDDSTIFDDHGDSTKNATKDSKALIITSGHTDKHISGHINRHINGHIKGEISGHLMHMSLGASKLQIL